MIMIHRKSSTYISKMDAFDEGNFGLGSLFLTLKFILASISSECTRVYTTISHLPPHVVACLLYEEMDTANFTCLQSRFPLFIFRVK